MPIPCTFCYSFSRSKLGLSLLFYDADGVSTLSFNSIGLLLLQNSNVSDANCIFHACTCRYVCFQHPQRAFQNYSTFFCVYVLRLIYKVHAFEKILDRASSFSKCTAMQIEVHDNSPGTESSKTLLIHPHLLWFVTFTKRKIVILANSFYFLICFDTQLNRETTGCRKALTSIVKCLLPACCCCESKVRSFRCTRRSHKDLTWTSRTFFVNVFVSTRKWQPCQPR